MTYSYDGQNRRIRKVVEAGESDITYDYYYNESWQVLEVQKAGRTNKTYQQYVWGAQYIDAPVVQFRDTADDGTLDQALYYTYDAQFNVTALIAANGTVAERYVYDPYGKVTFKAADWSDAASQAKSAYDNEILYCGYRFDPESALYHVRRRPYHPTLGRWTTTDPIGYGDGTSRNLLLLDLSRRDRFVGTIQSRPGVEPSIRNSLDGEALAIILRLGRRGLAETADRRLAPVQHADKTNLYAYVCSEPVDGLDPSGLDRYISREGLHGYFVIDEWDEKCCKVIGYWRIDFVPNADVPMGSFGYWFNFATAVLTGGGAHINVMSQTFKPGNIISTVNSTCEGDKKLLKELQQMAHVGGNDEDFYWQVLFRNCWTFIGEYAYKYDDEASAGDVTDSPTNSAGSYPSSGGGGGGGGRPLRPPPNQ